MPIDFDCPYCEAHIRVPDGTYGRRGACPVCLVRLTVPTKAQLANLEAEAAKDPAKAKFLEVRASLPAIKKVAESVPVPASAPVAMASFGAGSAATPQSPSPVTAIEKTERKRSKIPGWGGSPSPTAEPELTSGTVPGSYKPIDDSGETDDIVFAEASEDADRAASSPPQFTSPAPVAAPALSPFEVAAAVAAASVDQRSAVSMAASRRGTTRRKKKDTVPNWLLGIVFLGLIAIGGVVGYVVLQQPTVMGGTAPAFTVPQAEIPAAVIPWSLIEAPKDVRDDVERSLSRTPIPIVSSLMEVFIGANNQGLRITVGKGRNTEYVRLLKKDVPELTAYAKEHEAELIKQKNAAYSTAPKAFVEACARQIRKEGGDNLASFRDTLGLGALTGSLGFQLTAMDGATEYRCVAEDDEGFWFLIPSRLKTFFVEGRDMGGSRIPLHLEVRLGAPPSDLKLPPAGSRGMSPGKKGNASPDDAPGLSERGKNSSDTMEEGESADGEMGESGMMKDGKAAEGMKKNATKKPRFDE